MDEQRLDVLCERIERVERQIGQWRRIAVVLAGVLACVIAGNVAAWLGVGSAHAAEQVITTQKLIITDDAGRTRLELGTGYVGSPIITAYDKEDRVRARLSLLGSGAPSLEMFDQSGNTRASIGINGLNRAIIAVQDTNEKARVELVAQSNGPPRMSLLDQEGVYRSELSIDENGSSYVTVYDANGANRAQMSATEHDYAEMTVFDEYEDARAVMGAYTDDEAYVTVYDAYKETGAELGVAYDGDPYMTTFDDTIEGDPLASWRPGQRRTTTAHSPHSSRSHPVRTTTHARSDALGKVR